LQDKPPRFWGRQDLQDFYGFAIKLSCLSQFTPISRGELGGQKRHFAKQNIKKYACHFFIGKPLRGIRLTDGK